MKKRYKLSDVDCANCAAKMEEQISKLPGVIRGKTGSSTEPRTMAAR